MMNLFIKITNLLTQQSPQLTIPSKNKIKIFKHLDENNSATDQTQQKDWILGKGKC
uniref:Uncharacterized protein n=1 Tax=Rhizophora mucronata TaxID=61149 RepID=A0A2P2PB27_RHIMU